MARVCSKFSAPAPWVTTVIDTGGTASLQPRTKSLACLPLFLVKITRREASAKRLWHKQNPWELLLKAAQDSTPRYDNYSHAEHADVYRVHLSPETALSLMSAALKASPGTLHKKLAALRPPAALQIFVPRKDSSGANTPP